jgi:hypothetical protein
MLEHVCLGKQMLGNHCYVDNGPPFIGLLHPALGPLWDVVRQKVQLLLYVFIHIYNHFSILLTRF